MKYAAPETEYDDRRCGDSRRGDGRAGSGYDVSMRGTLPLCLALPLLTQIWAGCQQPLAPCQISGDCLSTEVCVEQRCRLVCGTSSDCPATELCEQGACLALGGACSEQADCLNMETCVEGSCRRLCVGDEVCRAGEWCEEGTCMPASDAGALPDAAVVDGAVGDAALDDLKRAEDAATVDAWLLDGEHVDLARPDTLRPDTAVSDTAAPDTARPDSSRPDTSRPDTARPDTAALDTARPDTAVPDAARPDTSRPDTSAPDAYVPSLCQLQYGDAPGHVPCSETASSCQFNATISGSTCHALCREHGGVCLEAYDNPTGAGQECTSIGTDTCATEHDSEICVCSQDGAPPSCNTLYGAVPEYLLCAETTTECRFSAATAGASCETLCGQYGGACLDADGNPSSSVGDCSVDAPGDDCSSSGNTSEICVCERYWPPPACDTLYGGATGYLSCWETALACIFNTATNGGTCDDACTAHGGVCLDGEDDSDGVGEECLPSSVGHDCDTVHSTQICACSRQQPPPSCDDIYGGVTAYALCDATPYTCRFHAQTAGGNCEDLCGGLGYACLDADDDGDNPDAGICETSSTSDDCSTVHSDQICVCSRL